MGWEPLPSYSAPPVPVRDALDSWAATLGMDSVEGVTKLFLDWESVVGEDLARHCRPVSLERQTLLIEAADQVWATELGWMTELLVARCAEALGPGQVTGVRITTRRA